MAKVLIFAGANGSGKTTLASTVIGSATKFINADEIKDKEKLSDLDAGKKALKEIDLCVSKGINFAFETTMSGLGLFKRIKRLKNKQYFIVIFYLFVYPIDLLVERIKERVKKGGHYVSHKDIVRRYYRSTYNFWSIYKNYADEWAIINNNEFQYKNIVVGNKNKFQTFDEEEHKIFKEVLRHGK